MLIILGSDNISKKRALSAALESLSIKDYEIICHKSESNVPSKPIGYEILRGALNRNEDSIAYAVQNNIPYDYVCAIEGGFTIEDGGLPFVVTYAVMEDKNGKKSTGKSLGIRIRKDMFDYIQKGHSLNDLIEELLKVEDNKENGGITGYLTGGLYNREKVDQDAVATALIPYIFKEQRDNLSLLIKRRKNDTQTTLK